MRPISLVAVAVSLLFVGRLAPAQAQAPAPVPAAPLLATVDDITRQVVALRGLSLKQPFASGVLNRDQIGAKLQERIQKEYSPGEIAVESRMLKRLGLLPLDADYQKLLNDLLMEQVAGFYDPFARQLYIADWLGTDLQRPAMAHEILHALQDQHFDLKDFSTPIKDDGDRQLARSALVEGDGTAVMLEFVVQSMGLDLSSLPNAINVIADRVASGQLAGQPGLAKAPRFLRETLTFPYFSGMKFVMRLHKEKGWSAVDAAFKSPPESTAQVLHPEKYLGHEHPVLIATAPIAGLAPWKELRHDVLGEFEWKVLLASRLDDGLSERAAAGWRGDRMATYGAATGPVAVIDLSTWDSDEDAIQMESALRKWMARQTGVKEPAADRPGHYEVGGEAWLVERRGREVLALFGVASTARDGIASEVWSKWKIALPIKAPHGHGMAKGDKAEKIQQSE